MFHGGFVDSKGKSWLDVIFSATLKKVAKIYPIVYSTGPKCNYCGKPPESPTHWQCNACRAAYMREYRKTHPLIGEAKRKANARSYLHRYVKLGKITKGVCEVCGDDIVEAHHRDYSKPLEVQWLCVKHHLAEIGFRQRVERYKRK